MKTIKGQELLDAVMGLPGWSLDQGELKLKLSFKDFAEAMAFVNKVADLAEAAGHHPDIDIRYNQVLLGLVTHDAGGITDLDIALAQKVNKTLEDQDFAR
jgi:4a-hydroxytetrahydrobiopterin dehydratase